MTRRNWLKAHSRQVITHTSVIVGFLLFTLFAAEPLFDRLENIPGEAEMHSIQLPAETHNIRCNIEEITVHVNTIGMWGWAFIEGYDVDPEETDTYIALRSEKTTYVFSTSPRERPDVTAHFEELGLNLDWSGFLTDIPVRKIARGEYVVGIYIRKGDIEALQYTDSRVEI